MTKKIDVSVIIPSFNKYPLFLLSLYSLEKQSYPLSNIEVIFVDDGSTDSTREVLMDYHPPFFLKYIQCKKNQGRSAARNTGIKEANGSIIIFLDAEMITPPNFIKDHCRHHRSDTKLVVSGGMYDRHLYSYIFPEFTTDQIEQIRIMTKKNKNLLSRFEKYELNQPAIYPLIGKDDLNKRSIKQMSFFRPHLKKEIIDKYGEQLNGFDLPWLSFMTANVSINKELLISAGLFDESLIDFGWEDRELGYRLYKECGVKFLVDKQIACYHQEHPISQNKLNLSMNNYLRFQEKHPDIDVLLLALSYISPRIDYEKLNNILKEYKLLSKMYPNKFKIFKKTFITALKKIPLILSKDEPISNIVSELGMGMDGDSNLIKTISIQRDKIKKLRHFNNLIFAFDHMVKKKKRNR